MTAQPPAVAIAALTGDRHGDVARLFHSIWHETQAHLQDPRLTRHRDLAFFQQRIAQRAERTFAATVEGTIVGFACTTAGRLDSLFVSRAARGRGIGEHLLAEAERRMMAGGATNFELDCIAGNWGARRFYERHGWRVSETSVMESETPDGVCRVEAWRMVKP